MIDSKKLVDGYLTGANWKVKENSNAPFSFGALGKHMIDAVSKDYWLNEVYTPEILNAHNAGFFHIHDLGGLTLYCCGYSFLQLIKMGIKGIPNVPVSAPAKHTMSIINQLCNIITIYQNEIMGAVAFSSVDTYLAPFVKADGLTYDQVKQHLQNLVYSVNSNSRGGAEPAFTNFTFDLTPPTDLLDTPVVGPNFETVVTYRDCQKEMDMINKAFYEIMLEGDAEGKPFAYPIPTYNIHPRFDWDNPNNDGLWEMAGKFGYPYFANFINSDMDVADARSMCCRLRLDLRELRRKTGGLFGSDDFTGSIGVATMDLPKFGYLANTEDEFYELLAYYMHLAKQSLEIKRNFLQEEMMSRNAIPAFMQYVGTLDNHFSTIGLVGMNEMCLNLFGENIEHPKSVAFCQEVLNFMRELIADFQEETGNLYNLEATPAESTCHRLALKDKQAYPNIITQGKGDSVYYTNSCRLPVDNALDIDEIAMHQSQLQPLFNGGTAEHLYIAHSISGNKAKHIVKSVFTNHELQYLSLSPLTKFCPEHGFMRTNGDYCPICHKELDQRQRVTGYIRSVANFNNGKAQEFKDRNQLLNKDIRIEVMHNENQA